MNINKFTKRNQLISLIARDRLGTVDFVLRVNRKLATLTNKHGENAFHFAVKRQSVETLQLLLKYSNEINAKTKNGLTPLHIAAKNGNQEIYQILIEHSADMQLLSRNGKSLLYFAVQGKNKSILKHILNNATDLKSNAQKRALRLAIISSDPEFIQITEMLLNAKLNIDRNAMNDPKLLHAIVRKGYINILRDLLFYGRNVDLQESGQTKQTLLHTAIEFKQEEIIKILLQYGANVNAKDYLRETPLAYALKIQNDNIASLLVESKFKIKQKLDDYCHVLQSDESLQRGEMKTIDFLLKYHFNINSKAKNGTTFLQMAIDNRWPNVVEILLNNSNLDINLSGRKGLTPLHLIAQYSDDYLIVKLLQKCAKINARDASGMSALFHGVMCGNEDTVQLLLEQGADVNLIDNEGNTPLHVAVGRGNSDLAELLLEYGSKINYKNEKGVTSLHIAVSKSHIHLVELLLYYDANPNCKSYNGIVPLHIAANTPSKSIDILLLNGADVNCKSNNNNTALDAMCSEKLSLKSANRFNIYNRDNFGLIGDANPDDLISEFGYDLFPSNRRKAHYVLQSHIIKLKCANKYICAENIKAIKSVMNEFHVECQNEIEKMKTTYFDGCMSFYDILKMPTNKLAKNNHIRWTLQPNLKKEFPIYASMISYKLTKILKRFQLMTQVDSTLELLLNGLPTLCIDKIAENLSILDLRSLLVV